MLSASYCAYRRKIIALYSQFLPAVQAVANSDLHVTSLVRMFTCLNGCWYYLQKCAMLVQHTHHVMIYFDYLFYLHVFYPVFVRINKYQLKTYKTSLKIKYKPGFATGFLSMRLEIEMLASRFFIQGRALITVFRDQHCVVYGVTSTLNSELSLLRQLLLKKRGFLLSHIPSL
ncbi:hypothetical protein JSR02_00495 [Candidatus Vidania fulgoroideae]|uniref:Uncharacterized protein n=1 Tax=Candidatus Vidania fulgoroideorum TaxID=881286 RepID=A0A974X794_9PROT|nr:hypothetical protein JSR02_00495 [Candidatus Vidania fulgoroideae]